MAASLLGIDFAGAFLKNGQKARDNRVLSQRIERLSHQRPPGIVLVALQGRVKDGADLSLLAEKGGGQVRLCALRRSSSAQYVSRSSFAVISLVLLFKVFVS
jgi:hypothetical protein